MIYSWQVTPRGLVKIEFMDDNGDACTLQESSSADEPKIWLGQNSGDHLRESRQVELPAKWVGLQVGTIQ